MVVGTEYETVVKRNTSHNSNTADTREVRLQTHARDYALCPETRSTQAALYGLSAVPRAMSS